MGRNLEDNGVGKNFMDRNQNTCLTLESINKWDLLRLRNSCKSKEIIKRVKRQPTNFEKILTNKYSNKGLLCRIYKELNTILVPKFKDPIQKWASEMNKNFSEKEILQAYKYMKKFSTFLAICEMQIKTKLRFTYHPRKNGYHKEINQQQMLEGLWGKRSPCRCWWECKLVQPLWKAVWRSLKKLELEIPFNPAIPLLGSFQEELKT